MSFGSIIKKLRRERDLTQEELAEMLSISSQAVSRWETDVAMPDISLLPTLCNYFGVSADMLLGIDLENKKERIKTIIDEADKYSSRGYHDKAIEILSAGYREYPDAYAIIRDLMYVKYWKYNCDQSQKNLREEAIKHGEDILAKCTEDSIRQSAIQVLCYCYSGAGRMDDAVKLAESMPCIALSSEMLLSGIYTGDKGYEARQTELNTLFQFLSNSLYSLTWSKNDSGEFIYTDKEKALLNEKRIALIKLFFEDGNCGFYHTDLCDAYRDQAVYYAKIGNTEMAIESLRTASENAAEFERKADGGEYTCLAFRKEKYGSWSGNSTDNYSARLLGKLDDPVFDEIRENEEFTDIKAKLSNYSGKWQVK